MNDMVAIDEKVFNTKVRGMVRGRVMNVSKEWGCFSQDDIEDIQQDILAKLWNARSSFNPERGNLEQWVFTSTNNYLIDRKKKWNGHERVTSPLCGIVNDESRWNDEEGALRSDSRGTSVVYTRDESDEFDDRDIRSYVMERLSAEQRKILQMHFDGYDGQEMADEFHCTPNAAYQRLKKAKDACISVYRMALAA